MRALSASDLLRVWERGLGKGPIGRALELLSAACPEADAEALAALSIGQRDALLLQLRQWTFGAPLTGSAVCSRCAEPIEITVDPAMLPAAEPAAKIDVEVSGYQMRLRPPNSRDVAAANDPDLAKSRLQLLAHCLLEARFHGAPAAAADLPDDVLDEAERRLAEADPHSDIRLVTTCPGCGAERKLTFDIVSFFWREIEAWARRILRDVHAIASAYGWGEEQILALSPLRRQCYLDLVGA